MSRTPVAVLALTATTFVAGCGGSGSGEHLTRSELIAKADVICRRVNTKVASTTVHSQRDIARVAPELAAYERTAFVQMSKLRPPASMASDWRLIMTGTRTIAAAAIKIGEYARMKNLRAASGLINGTNSLHRRVVAAAQRSGLAECARTA